ASPPFSTQACSASAPASSSRPKSPSGRSRRSPHDMTLREQIRRNRVLTTELLAFFAVLMGGVAAALYAVYGAPAAIAVGIGALGWALFSWFLSAKVVSGITGAKPVTKAEQ